MLLDIQWCLDFLPWFHRVSLIKHSVWDFESLNFPLMAPLVARSALALSFADYISPSTRPINALERFTIVVALKHWALLLQGHKFIIACDNSAASAVAVINSTTSKVARTLSFSVASDNFGSPLLFSFLKRAHRMFRANTINLRIVWVAGTQMLQLVTVFIVYVVTLISFFHFHDVDSACFSFDVAWLHLSFLFCFVFFCRPLCWICSPTSSGRCVCRPLTVFCLASYYIGSRNVHTEKEPLIFAVIRLSVNWGLFSPLLLVSSLLVSILPI